MVTVAHGSSPFSKYSPACHQIVTYKPLKSYRDRATGRVFPVPRPHFHRAAAPAAGRRAACIRIFDTQRAGATAGPRARPPAVVFPRKWLPSPAEAPRRPGFRLKRAG
jgi:hypothetical protein